MRKTNTMLKVNLIIIFIWFLLFSCNQKKNQLDNSINKTMFVLYEDRSKNLCIDTLDNKFLLNILFDNSISCDTDVVWTPSLDDYIVFKDYISDDSLCHTSIDTSSRLISNINNIDNRYHFKFFKTIKYTKHYHNSSLIGIALFQRDKKKYKFINFKKGVFETNNLSFNKDTISLEYFGLTPLLKISGYYNESPKDTRVRYYSLKDFHLIYDYCPKILSSNIENGITRQIINKSNYGLGCKFDIETVEWNRNKSTKTIKHYIYDYDYDRFE